MLLSGRKWTFVPVFTLATPAFFNLLVGSPFEYVCCQVEPSRQISSSSSSLRAFTQETPTPCSPPETLYVEESNFAPACSLVITTCAADTFSPSISMSSTGMPRPSSTTVTELSVSIVTSIFVAYPASASSTELSTTSYTRWCSPSSPVDPMYIAGRLQTASMPPRTLIESAVYSLLVLPLPPLIGVTLPFFVLVSAMGVLISLVAIPLRENVPNFCR